MSEATEEAGPRPTQNTITAGPENQLIKFDRKKYKKLQMAYNRAVAAEKDQFKFDDNDYVTRYAKYLLEYLDDRLA